MGKILYPDKFKDVDPEKKATRYFKCSSESPSTVPTPKRTGASGA
jgi:spore germination cell wall hydrolase CwlJ-like protein